jgi:hypothetical protein
MYHELYDVTEKTIDYAFEGRFMLNMFEYLKSIKAPKVLVTEFLVSATAASINILINDLEEYIAGGSDSMHKQLREGYGHLSKPEARKIKDYLNKLLEDAQRYERKKRPGRKRDCTK